MPADPTFTVFLVGALTGLGAFAGWLVRWVIADLQKSRDRSLTMAEGSTVAIDRLADEISNLRADLALERRKKAQS